MSSTLLGRVTDWGCGTAIDGEDKDRAAVGRTGGASPLVSSLVGELAPLGMLFGGSGAKMGWMLEERNVGDTGRRGGVADMARGDE
jgi:hypothetical protein